MLPSNSTAKLLDMEHMQIKYVEQNESCIRLYVDMKRRLCRCPDCGLLTEQIHDYRTQRVKDSHIQGRSGQNLGQRTRGGSPHVYKGTRGKSTGRVCVYWVSVSGNTTAGIPIKSTVYRWLEHKQAGLENWQGTTERHISGRTHLGCTEEHPLHASAELKLEILRRCFENGADVEYVSRETGYSRTSIYKWRRQYLEKGAASLMPPKKDTKRSQSLFSEEDTLSVGSICSSVTDSGSTFRSGHIERNNGCIKKDPGADMSGLRNQEKAAIVDALKTKYPLPVLLDQLNCPRSSYYYQRKIRRKRLYKYACLRPLG